MLEFIKRFLSQYHALIIPADVEAVVKSFQHVYPDARIGIATLEALREVEGFKSARVVILQVGAGDGNRNMQLTRIQYFDFIDYNYQPTNH